MNFGGGLVAQISILHQRLIDDFLQAMRKSGHGFVQGNWRLTENGVNRHGPSGSGKSLLAGGHFVKQNAEGKKIGASIERLASRLLRRHVGDGADGCAGVSELSIH